jgi:nucleotide-binding universal stress UspA family protein
MSGTGSHTKRPRTIVVGYDDEAPARRALERAIEEVRASHGHLIVVAVAEMPLDPEGPQNFGTLDDSPARMIPLVPSPELEGVLERARRTVEGAGVQAEYVWAAGDPAVTIVDTARDRHADLVVLGSHHHGFLGRLFGLDVAAEVERELGSATLVVE